MVIAEAMLGLALAIFSAVRLPAQVQLYHEYILSTRREGAGSSREQLSSATIINWQGGFLGEVDADGNITNRKGRGVGKVAIDGTVRNSQGDFLGKGDADGNITNWQGVRVGKVAADGTVRNLQNNYMGKTIGSVNVVYKGGGALRLLFY